MAVRGEAEVTQKMGRIVDHDPDQRGAEAERQSVELAEHQQPEARRRARQEQFRRIDNNLNRLGI